MRHLALALVLLSSPCFAQSAPEAQAQREPARRDVKTGDACGASRYAHLVGQSYALHYAALPPGTVVYGPTRDGAVHVNHRVQTATDMITLEYRAQRLNVVLGDGARILSIACH